MENLEFLKTNKTLSHCKKKQSESHSSSEEGQLRFNNWHIKWGNVRKHTMGHFYFSSCKTFQV